MRQLNILATVEESCERLPVSGEAAKAFIADSTRLPSFKSGKADSWLSGSDFKGTYPDKWENYKTFLGEKVVPGSEYALNTRWCIGGASCFDTKAIVDGTGRLRFEPVLSVGVWQQQVSSRGAARDVIFLDGLGSRIAEYSIDISYLSDSCTITPGSVSFDIRTVALNNALFDGSTEKGGPTIYKGTLDCSGAKQDWVLASASLSLKTLFNPQVPALGIPVTSGTTRNVVIRFNVSASGEDRTEVLR